MYDSPLYQAVLDYPDDDDTRLVLADWLEEHGDRRAEFIRVQIAIAEARQDGRPVDDALKERENELLRSFREQWTEQLQVRTSVLTGKSRDAAKKLVSKFLYFRGFPSWLATSPRVLVRHGDELMQIAPWQYIRFDRSNEQLDDLADWSGLANFRTLTIMGHGGGLEVFLRSRFLNQLQRLTLHSTGRDDRQDSLGRLVSRLRDDGCLQSLTEFHLA